MDTVVLKFGGSSLANNERLMMVANKIIEKAMKHKVVVVVSAVWIIQIVPVCIVHGL